MNQERLLALYVSVPFGTAAPCSPQLHLAKSRDYVLLFAEMLRTVGYLGDAVAIAALSDVSEFQLGLPRGYDSDDRAFDVDRIISRPLRASVSEMPSATNAWLKKTMDRIFLAAGIASGAYFLNEGGLIEQ
jgi:transcriptional regulator GlxA family with amidase domain